MSSQKSNSMNISLLMVDDEPEFILSTMKNVDFESLGFSIVLSAESSEAAKKIILEQSIDILIADIEMPGGSGLELLEWIRDSHLEITTLFCTSYANFDYAQKAIELNCFGYYLKPVNYEDLTSKLNQAILKIKDGRAKDNLQKYGNLWLKRTSDYKYSFWHQVINQYIDNNELSSVIDRYGLVYSPDDIFVVLHVTLDDTLDNMEQWKKYSLRNIITEVFSGPDSSLEAYIPVSDTAFLVIIRRSESYTKAEFENQLKSINDLMINKLSSWLYVYYCFTCHFNDVQSLYKRQNEVQLKYFPVHPFIIENNDLPQIENSQIGHLSTETLLHMLQSENTEYVITAISHKLQTAGDIILRSKALQLRRDVQHICESILSEQNIDYHDLYNDPLYSTILRASVDSLPHFKRYISYLIHKTTSLYAEDDANDSVIDQVQDYVKRHLDEKMTRISLAKLVFMNPDYLARLFKQETGLSISAFIQNERIKKAKELLTQTNEQVQEIALTVGYDNIPYFITLFKEKVGVSPNEFRKNRSL